MALGRTLARHPAHLVHVDPAVLLADAVLVEVVDPAGEVDLVPVGQVPAVGEGEPESVSPGVMSAA